MKSKVIETYKCDWGSEFSNYVNIKYTSEIGQIVSMSCHTMLYKIADEFSDGIYRKEILKQFGINV